MNYDSDRVNKIQSLKVGESVTYMRVLDGKYYVLTPFESKILVLSYSNGLISVTKSLSLPSTPICFHFISLKLIVAVADGNYYLFNSEN